MKRIAMVAIGLLVTVGAQSAGLYKCMDETGAVTYSQTQCSLDAAPIDVDVHRPTAEEVYEHQRRVQDGAMWVNERRARRAAAISARELDAARDRYRQKSQEVIQDLGAPSTIYRSGGYERRTYRSGDKIKSVTTQEGEITDTSIYRWRR